MTYLDLLSGRCRYVWPCFWEQTAIRKMLAFQPFQSNLLPALVCRDL